MKNAVMLLAVGATVGWGLWPRPVLSHERVTTTVSFDKEIVRILNRKCIACHSDNNLGVPFTTYEQTRPWARAIEEEVLRRQMPPWRAVQGYGKFANENGLTNREQQFLIAWVEGNGPKTKQQSVVVDLDRGATPESERLNPDFAKWQLGKPGLQAVVPAFTVAPGPTGEVRRAVIDPGLTSERHLRALEYKPDDRRVVRAVHFSVEGTGQWLGSWTPWYGTTTLPKGTAYVLPRNTRIVAEIHYGRREQPIEDRGTLGLYFQSGAGQVSPVDLILEAAPQGEGRAGRQRMAASVTLAADTSVLAMRPDVLPGVQSVEVSAKKPDGTTQVLLLIRDALPGWPTPYILEQPATLPKGTELQVAAYRTLEGQSPPASMKLTVSVITTRPGRTAE